MRRVLSGIGKVLVTVGLLILLFVGYQLWGTGIYTARAQNQLESEFEESLASAGSTQGTTSTTLPTTATTVPVPTTVPPPPPSVPEGDAVAHLVIPRIGVDTYVIEGIDESDLRKGPGHYPATPYPGQRGNAAIAGHRTTYGAPFGELDSLEVGDVMEITTLQGSFEYRVYDKVVVSPTTSEVLDPDATRPATLTLTTCHPKYSAAERLIVQAELVIPPGVAPLPSSVDPDDPAVNLAESGLSGDSDSKLPTVLAGLLTALVGGVWWLVFHRHPRWTTWVLGAIPFAVVLAVFYYTLERVLPANY